MSITSREERLRGGLLGLLVGDALGVPYEFNLAHHLPPADQIEMDPPRGYRFYRAHGGIPSGTWSDDGAQALCLLESLLERGRLDVDDLGERLIRWADAGHLAVDGRAYGLGRQTARALANLRAGVPAGSSGPADERNNGNGSLMRALPLALWHAGTDAELVADAMRQSVVTHGHAHSQVACALYVVWARRVLHAVVEPWSDAVDTVRRVLPDAVLDASLDHVVRFTAVGGTGYVVDALHSARVAVDAGPYEVAVRRAIAFGEDTDTTACIAGGIAGLRDGVGAIPARWLRALRGREIVDPLLDRLVTHAVATAPTEG